MITRFVKHMPNSVDEFPVVFSSVHQLWNAETSNGKPLAQNTNDVGRPKFRTATSEEGNFNDCRKTHTWKIKRSITFLIRILTF